MQSLENPRDLISQSKFLVEKFDGIMQRIRPVIPGDFDDLKVDHLCIKCATPMMFEGLRDDLQSSRISRYMYQSHIGGRPIAYFRLKKGIPTKSGVINYLELAAPKKIKKKGEKVSTDFHHVELYLKSTRNPHDIPEVGDIAKVLRRSGEKVTHKKRQHHEMYDIHDPSGIVLRISCTAGPLINKIVNQEMAD